MLIRPLIWIETAWPELSDEAPKEYVSRAPDRATDPPLMLEGLTAPTVGAPVVPGGTAMVTDETDEVEPTEKV